MKGPFPELERGHVDVWFANIDRSASRVRDFEALLSPEEATRAQRFRFLRDRTRYVIQHGVLRSLLVRYVACGSHELDIRCDLNGKPYLAGQRNAFPLQFSVSHSDAFAAFALGPYGRIGVDIEKIRELPEMLDIVSQHFTPRERGEILSRPEGRRLDLFYRFWTRKEALLKAQGEGLLRPLNSIEVARRGEPPGPWKVRVAGCLISEDFWVMDLNGPAGFAASVAVAGRIDEISVHHLWI